jgi:methionyl-tRNA formyltransferase
MRIDAGLDTGDILLQQEIGIEPDDTAETLAPRLAAAGADLLVETLRGLQAGKVHPRKQDDSKSSLAPILKKEDGRIDFHRPAQEICHRLRGFQPWPGAFTSFRGKNLNVSEARVFDGLSRQRADSESEMLIEGQSLIVGCGRGTTLELIEVQPEGKKRMPARDFIHGYHPEGEKLGL